MHLILSLKMTIQSLLNTLYSLTLLISFFLHLLQRSASPPPLLSIPPFSRSCFLTFCYWICFPRTSEFASTHLVRLTIIWPMTFRSHLLHPERKWALFLSTYLPLHTKPQLHSLPTRAPHAWESKVILNKGIWPITSINVQFTLGQANEVFFFKVHLPCPPKLIACAISEKSWS